MGASEGTYDESGDERYDHESQQQGRNGEQLHKGNERKPRLRIAVVIEDFSFLWFTISMNTGILSILLHQNPYRFHGIDVLSTIMFVFNLILFTVEFSVLLLRIIIFPKPLCKSMKTDLTELAMTAAVPIAWLTLVAQLGLTVSTASWGGHAFTLVSCIMWWIGTMVMFSVACFVFVMVSKYPITKASRLNSPLVTPFVGAMTNAVVGGLITNYSFEMSARMAVPVLVVSYLLLGIGCWVAILVLSIYTARLLSPGLPRPRQSPSLFLLIGVPGQTASAFLLLGSAARMHFPKYMRGTIFTPEGGATFAATGVLFSLLFLGLANFFSIFAIYSVLEVVAKREYEYSLIWWATIFPLATVNTAWNALAKSMDSPTLRVLSSVFLIALFLDYFVNWGFTIYHIAIGKLLSGEKPAARVEGEATSNGDTG